MSSSCTAFELRNSFETMPLEVMNFFWLFCCFPQFSKWMLSESCNSENGVRKSKITIHWQTSKNLKPLPAKYSFCGSIKFLWKKRNPKKSTEKKKIKAALQMWHRNCFGLFYITVRHTLTKVCLLQSVLTSSPTTASKQTARSVLGGLQSVQGVTVLAVACFLYHKVWLLNVLYGLVKLGTIWVRPLINTSWVTAGFVPSMDSIPFWSFFAYIIIK